ncbi:MAG TPA: O-antigen ligase family protein [Gemmatimonadales bacterium]|nr:O-antigen ligase family protein [Gemmatimonadales bacterium]
MSPTAGLAFGGLLLFIALVYSNPGNWFEQEPVPFAKVAAGLALVALAGSWLLYGHRLRVGGWAGVCLITMFGLIGLSTLWSPWSSATLSTFLDGLKYLAIFFVTVNVLTSRERIRTFIATLAWASVIPALGCIKSWIVGEHLVENGRAGWIGVFENPNDMAYYLVIGIAMVLTARELAEKRSTRVAFAIALAPLFFALMLTKSRGGMLATGAVLFVWCLRWFKHARALAVFAVVVGGLFYSIASSTWKERTWSSTAYGQDVSAKGRIDAWRTGMNMALDRPWTGVGAGAFMVAWPEYAPGDAGAARTQHNTFIQLISELGFPGLLLFLTAFATGLAALRGSAGGSVEDAHIRRGVLCALVGFTVCSLTGGLAYSWPFYLLTGVAVAMGALRPKRQQASAVRRDLPQLASVSSGA